MGDRRIDRKQREGSVVTYSVAGFMLIALLFYLAVAFFADDPGGDDSPSGEPVAEQAP